MDLIDGLRTENEWWVILGTSSAAKTHLDRKTQRAIRDKRVGDAASGVLRGAVASPGFSTIFSDTSSINILQELVDTVTSIKSNQISYLNQKLSLDVSKTTASILAGAIAKSIMLGPSAIAPSVIASIGTKAAVQTVLSIVGRTKGTSLVYRLQEVSIREVATIYLKNLASSFVEFQTDRTISKQVGDKSGFSSIDEASDFTNDLLSASQKQVTEIITDLISRFWSESTDKIDFEAMKKTFRQSD